MQPVDFARLLCCGLLISPFMARGQDNYEIQVYGSETVAAGRTMVELHSNFIFQGSKTTEENARPSMVCCLLTTRFMKPSRSPTGSRLGSKRDSMCSQASSRMKDGNGSATIYARASACPRIGIGLWA